MSFPLVWLFAGLVLIIVEIFSPALVAVFFGIGALAASLSAVFDVSPTGQLTIFALCSALSLFLFRRWLSSIFSGRRTQHKEQEEAHHPLQGSHGRVTKAIPAHGYGEIEAGGSFWRATSDTALSEGTPIKVLGTAPKSATILLVSSLGAHSMPTPPPSTD